MPVIDAMSSTCCVVDEDPFRPNNNARSRVLSRLGRPVYASVTMALRYLPFWQLCSLPWLQQQAVALDAAGIVLLK